MTDAKESSKPAGRVAAGSSAPKAHRSGVFIRLDDESKARAQYWADKHGHDAIGDYIAEALLEKIARENRDYDLPTLEIARLNQLIDEIKALSSNSANLERVVTTGFKSLIGLTRGDNYLLDDEDGELT
jgi:hypothetical protein